MTGNLKLADRNFSPKVKADLLRLGRRMRLLRDLERLSTKAVRRATGTSEAVVGAYERMDRVPSIGALLEYCEAMGWTIWDLLPPPPGYERLLTDEERAAVLEEVARDLKAR